MPNRSRKALPTRCGGLPAIAPMPRLTLGSRKNTGLSCAWVSVMCRMRAFPERFLRRRLVDRSLGQCFGLLRRLDRPVEVASIGSLLRRRQRRRGRGPLVAQLAGFLVGGFRRGIGSLVIGFGCGKGAGRTG